MGYPMTYERIVKKNSLEGIPRDDREISGNIMADLRRLEQDQRDDFHLDRYARLAGVTTEQVKLILDAFFGEVSLPEGKRELHPEIVARGER